MIIIITIKSHSRVLVMACVSMPLRNLSAEAGRKPVQPHPSAVGAGARRSLLLGDRDEISYTTPIQQGTQGPSSTCKLTARALVTNRLHFRRHPVLSNVATHKMKTLGGSKARGCRLYARKTELGVEEATFYWILEVFMLPFITLVCPPHGFPPKQSFISKQNTINQEP